MYVKASLMGLVLFMLMTSISVADSKTDVLANISNNTWERIANGKEAWPESLFPMSSWTQKERNNIPADYFKKIEKREREWPLFINSHMTLFNNEFGLDIKNIYDLFLQELISAKEASQTTDTLSPVQHRKTLNRLIDVVSIKANQFRDVQGASIENIRVFSFKQGKLRSIPFDILEFSGTNQVVLPLGPEANPDDGDGVFNGTDRIFFMAADAGDQINKKHIQKMHTSLKDVLEISISCRKTNGTAWVYMASFQNKPPEKSPIDYIQFNDDTSNFFTPFLFAQFEPRLVNGKVMATLGCRSWYIAPSIGGIPIDINERLRIRTKLSFRPLGSRSQTEDDFTTYWRAWFDGRVISYSRATWKVETIMGIGSPTVMSDMVATSFFAFNTIQFYIPFDPSIVIKNLDLCIGEQLNSDAIRKNACFKNKLRFITPLDKEGYFVDGMMGNKETTRNSELVPWHLSTGYPGTLCMRTTLNDYLSKYSKNTLDWHDTQNQTSFDTHLKISKFDNRVESFSLEWCVVPDFQNQRTNNFNWNNLSLILDRQDNPLVYQVENNEEIVHSHHFHLPDIGVVKDHYKF